MSSQPSSDQKLSVFVTRRWPQAAEDALADHFDVTFNEDDVPLSRDALMDGFASHDIAAPTVSCLLYTSPSPRDLSTSRMPSSA